VKNIDLDRAFPQTPGCIHAAIEMGFRKGQNKMKMRNKIIAMTSAAAALLIMIAVAALAMGIDPTPAPDVLAQPSLKPIPAPAETATVYITEKGNYYHAWPDCSGMQGARAVSEAEAFRLNKKPCPVCIPISCNGHDGEEIEFIYYSQGGLYYHKRQECSGGEMPLKGEYLKVIQEFPDKLPCEACLPNGLFTCLHGKTFVVEAEPAEMPELVLAEETNAEPALEKEQSSSGVFTKVARRDDVFYTENGQYFHSDEHCRGMQGASAHSRDEAYYSGKIGCPWCLKVYCTEAGSFFHLFANCTGMQGASLRSVEEARRMQTPKTRCATCLQPHKVFATEMGRYCHVDQQCSGMKGAEALPLDIALIEKGKQLCPVCITIEPRIPDWMGMAVYYAADDPIYYHSDIACRPGMDADNPYLLSTARKTGRLPCECAAVYYSPDGGFYHVLPDCMGGSYTLVGNIDEACAAHNQRCPICMSPETVYATQAGKYFHSKPDCSGMMNAEASTPETEWQNGKTPCPTCIAIDAFPANLHYTLYEKTFGNLEQAAEACYGFMEEADGSYRLTDGKQTISVSRLIGFSSETHPEVKWLLEVVPTDPDNPDNTPEISSIFMGNVKTMPMMTMYSSAVNAMKNHLANAHPGNEEALFSHVDTVGVYFNESYEICACEMTFPCAMHRVHVQLTPEEESSGDRTWRVSTQLSTDARENAHAALETAAAKPLPENYDLFITAFGQGIESLKPGYAYDHSSAYSWVISNGDENYDIELCEVYPEGTAFFGEALPGLPELRLRDLSYDPAPVHAFMKNAPAPISSMYNSAQAEVEKLARIDAAEELPLDAVTVYFDANRRVRKCEMQFGSAFMDHVKLAWSAKNNGQIELTQSEFIKSK